VGGRRPERGGRPGAKAAGPSGRACSAEDAERPSRGRAHAGACSDLRAHRESRFGIGRARPEDFVFGTSHGTPLHYRNVVRRGLDAAVREAGLAGTLTASLLRSPPHVRELLDRRGSRRRLRITKAWPCLSEDHARRLRAPLRCSRARSPRSRRSRVGLWKDRGKNRQERMGRGTMIRVGSWPGVTPKTD
jgi:hypothetical protein